MRRFTHTIKIIDGLMKYVQTITKESLQTKTMQYGFRQTGKTQNNCNA